jgi:beta-lactamase superfamily II metal-dependent hydrolase
MRGAFACLFVLAMSLPAAQTPSARTLDVYVIDVDGGESTLFVSPSGESLLVDAGWPGFDGRDANRIAAVAAQAGVKQIDYLVVTHFHADHMGGVAQLAARLPIRHFIDHGADVQTGDRAAAAFQPYAALRSHGSHVEARPGMTIPIAGLTARIIAAGGAVLAAPLSGAGQPNPRCAAFKFQEMVPGQEATRAEDGRSVSTSITFGQFRTVIMGDLGWNLEHDVVCPNNKVGTVDLYLVSHHGAETSGSEAFVYALHPRVAVMNNGAAKGGAVQTFQILRQSPGLEDLWQNHYSIAAGDDNRAEPFIANLEPHSLSAQGGNGQPVAPNHMGAANWTKIAASADGSFTVTNNRSGFSKRYNAANTPSQQPASSATLDYEFFKAKVQPIFLAKRPGHARCIACHGSGTPLRLQPLSAGSTNWNEEESRKNFDAVRRVVVPGSVRSRLLVHPLAEEAGGDFYHNGGKHWNSQNDPEWQTLKSWVLGQTASAGR